MLGISIGFVFELSRNSQVENTLFMSEVSLLDQQLRSQVVGNFAVPCNVSKNSLFDFADTIYSDASQLEQYDGASNFQNTLGILHRRYDLLRLMVWSESKDLRERCGDNFHTAVYFYNYTSTDLNVKAEETTFSRQLEDIKSKHGSDLLLIPIAADLNLTSVDVLVQSYNITQLPAILIDEKIKVSGEIPSDKLESIIFNRSN